MKQADYEGYIHISPDMPDALNEMGKRNRLNILLVILHLRGKTHSSDIEILRSLTNAPILVIDKYYSRDEKIASLNAGADEYITWPATREEGIASARALVRRYTDYNNQEENVGILSRHGLFLNYRQQRVMINAMEIPFTCQEFALFCLLASHPCQVFTNEQIYQTVWKMPYTQPADNCINTCLRRMRRKLEQAAGNFCRIENKRGTGYYFIQ